MLSSFKTLFIFRVLLQTLYSKGQTEVFKGNRLNQVCISVPNIPEYWATSTNLYQVWDWPVTITKDTMWHTANSLDKIITTCNFILNGVFYTFADITVLKLDSIVHLLHNSTWLFSCFLTLFLVLCYSTRISSSVCHVNITW